MVYIKIIYMVLRCPYVLYKVPSAEETLIIAKLLYIVCRKFVCECTVYKPLYVESVMNTVRVL
jgi:hypothetical protein